MGLRRGLVRPGGSRSLQSCAYSVYGLLAGVLLLSPAVPAIVNWLVSEFAGHGAAPKLTTFSQFDLWRKVNRRHSIHRDPVADERFPQRGHVMPLVGVSARGGVALLYRWLVMASVQIATLGLLVSSRAQSIDGAASGNLCPRARHRTSTPCPVLALTGISRSTNRGPDPFAF